MILSYNNTVAVNWYRSSELRAATLLQSHWKFRTSGFERDVTPSSGISDVDISGVKRERSYSILNITATLNTDIFTHIYINTDYTPPTLPERLTDI